MVTVVRAARQSDKGPLMDFIKDVWGGHDYIPRVWDSWIRDRGGKVFVVEVDGKQVGMNRVRFLEDGLGWLEGARVHPDYRGRGLASLLGRKSMEFARERGVKVCRLTSNSRNRAAHRQVAKIGFKEVARMSLYVPRDRASFKPTSRVVQASEKDVDELYRRIVSSGEYKLGHGVYWDSFTAISLSPEILARLVREGSVLVSGKALAIAKPGGEGRETWRQVCFATGESSDAVRVIKHALGKEAGQPTGWRVVYAPQGSPLISTLRRVGFQRWGSFVLFGRRVAKN